MKTRIKLVMAGTVVWAMIFFLVSPALAVSSEELRSNFITSTKGKKIGLLVIGMTYELMRAWEYVIRTESKKLGMKYQLVDGNMNADLMFQGAKSLIKKGVDILVVQNLSMQQLSRELKKAEQAGTHVMQISLPSNYVSDAYIGPDWPGLGLSMAEEIVKDIGKGSGKSGKLAIICGNMAAADTVVFNRMAKKVFAKHPEIKVVANQATNWDANQYRNITASVLQQHPDLAAIWGHYGIHTMASGQAVREAGMLGKVIIYSTGAASQDIRNGIKEGLLTKYWGYNPLQQGHDVMSAARMILQSGRKAGEKKAALYTVIHVLTKDNYQKLPHAFFSVPAD